MANPRKAAGTRYESAVVTYLRDNGHPDARRVAQEGFADTGDIHGLSPFIVQCKAWKSWQDAIREGLDGAEKQKTHAREPYGVAFVKRARRGTGDGYAVMTVETFAKVLARLRKAEAILAEVAGPSGIFDEYLAEVEAA